MIGAPLRRAWGWLRRRRIDADLAEEIEAHRALREDDLRRAGMSAEDAAAASRRALGNVTSAREEAREVWGWRWLDRIAGDLRHGVRSLRRSPGFAALAVATMGLTIGATTVVFSAVDALLLADLPYADADRLVLLWGTERDGDARSQVSFTDVDDWRREATAFSQVVANNGAWEPTLGGGRGEPEHVAGLHVSDGYFALMRARPALGRLLDAGDQEPGRSSVVVLSHDAWRRRFGGDPTAVGRVVSIDGEPATIVGVSAPELASLPGTLVVAPTEIYVPLAARRDDSERSFTWLRAIARLRPGATVAEAQAELDVIARRQEAAYPETNARRGVRVVSVRDDLVRDVRRTLLVLQAAVVLVLLVACVNLSNVLLARVLARRRELAVRVALGAGRGRLVGQTVIEATLLAVAGGAVGTVVARWGVDALAAAGARAIPELAGVHMNLRVLAFTLATSLVTGLAVGLVPALRLGTLDLGGALRARGTSGARVGLRRGLALASVAASLVLVACAGLAVHSVRALLRVDPGFDPRDVLTARIVLPEARYPRGPRQVAFYRDVLARVRRLPGVASAGAVSVLPTSGAFNHTVVEVPGTTYPPGGRPFPDVYRVTPDYFRALAIPLVRGRGFTDADDDAHPPVAIVGETLARRLWADGDAVGKRLWSGSGNVERTVVGVVADVRHYGLDAPPTLELYVPHADNAVGMMTVVVRTDGAAPARALAAAVAAEVRAVDPEQAVYRVATMDDVVAATLAGRRLAMDVLAAFAAVALVLAALGVYGVLTYGVTQRGREIAIRLALGAGRRGVLALILGEGMALVGAGIAVGVVGALAAARAMRGMLYGVPTFDPIPLAVACGALAAAGLLACWLPARRACRIDPMVALRHE